MEEIGNEWIPTMRATRMLGLTPCTLRHKAYAYLTVRRFKNQLYYLRSELEAILAAPTRIRHQYIRDAIECNRRYRYLDESSERLINKVEAAHILGIHPSKVRDYFDTGRLTIHVPRGKTRPHLFGYDEVQELALIVAAEREAKCKSNILSKLQMKAIARRKRGKVTGRELSEWERDIGEWLTVRQVACMLDLTTQSVYNMIKRGRFTTVRKKREWISETSYIFIPKAEVKALQNDSDYIRRSRIYRRQFNNIEKSANQEGWETGMKQYSENAGSRHEEIPYGHPDWQGICPQTSSYFLAINNPMNPPPEDYNCGFTIAPPCGW